MRIGARLLQAATAGLYLGPLLAGMAGFGWAMLPPFVLIFTLWLVITRPQQWPQSAADWFSREAWLAMLSQVLSQTMLVAICFAVGRGIGGVTGALPMFHPILPVALSFAALTLGRAFWNPERALAEDLSIDELLYPAAHPPSGRPSAPGTEAAVAELLALPDAADPARALALVTETLEDADPFARLSALVEPLAALPTDRHRALRLALILWATEPEAYAAGTAPGALRAAFAASGSDAELLRLLLPRAAALAMAVPGRTDQFPDPAVLEDIARRDLPQDLSAALAGLVAELRRGPTRRRGGRAPRRTGGLQRA